MASIYICGCLSYQVLYVFSAQLEPTEMKLWRLRLDQAVAFQRGVDFYKGKKAILWNAIRQIWLCSRRVKCSVSLRAALMRVPERSVLDTYWIGAGDREGWLCPGSPPAAGPEAEVSPSWEALTASAGQRGPPPSRQKVSAGSSREEWQKAGGRARREWHVEGGILHW